MRSIVVCLWAGLVLSLAHVSSAGPPGGGQGGKGGNGQGFEGNGNGAMAMAMDRREKVVKVSADQVAPTDRKGFPDRAVLKDRMAAARRQCCNRSCRWMRTAMEH
jgi:hypothetical protein